MEILRKSLDLIEGKSYDDESGTGYLEGYGSVTGNIDRDGEIIAPGAFKSSVEAFVRDGFVPVGHDWGGLPVATIEDAREDEKGLWVKARFHSTDEAQAARTIVAERLARGKSVGLSIGFRVVDSERDDEGRRVIKSAELYEVSIVTVPANPLAMVTGAKGGIGMPFSEQLDALLAAADDAITRAEGIAEVRKSEGRDCPFGEERRAQFAELSLKFADLAETPPEEADEIKRLEAILDLERRFHAHLYQAL
jgi:HK97 family phage prohead protease